MRPKPGDYNLYYDRYISLIEEDDIINVIEKQKKSSEIFLKSFTEENGIFSYAEGKWTVKEVLGHLIDTERIMAFRALAFARGEKQSIPGFEQDNYVAESNFNKRSLDDLINEFKTVRESNIILFKSIDKEVLNRRGTASDSEITVLALIYIIAGHEKHHMKFLRERYTIK
ncbi:MAG: DinB family protein [Ignavibacteria bacterium]|nr:MAG: DinB family protein [Ignavibacteria bacterium]